MKRYLIMAMSVVVACKTEPQATERTPATRVTEPTRPTRTPAPTLAPTASALAHDAERLATPAAWDAAADGYDALLRTCDAAASCQEAARGALVARRQALMLEALPRPRGVTAPLPLPPRVEAVVVAADRYVAMAEPTDPEVSGARFLAAAAYSRYGWTDDAIPRLEQIVLAHPDAEVGEYAANMLLDNFNRSGNYDELAQWARTMLADPTLLASRPNLRETLERIVAALDHRP